MQERETSRAIVVLSSGDMQRCDVEESASSDEKVNELRHSTRSKLSISADQSHPRPAAMPSRPSIAEFRNTSMRIRNKRGCNFRANRSVVSSLRSDSATHADRRTCLHVYG